jgi:hypothetical protein
VGTGAGGVRAGGAGGAGGVGVVTVIVTTTSLYTPLESDARTVKVNVPPVVGVPEISPVAGSSVRPAGSDPLEMVKPKVPTPPEAATFNEYAVPQSHLESSPVPQRLSLG